MQGKLLLAFCIVLLAGCSKEPFEEVKDQFVDGCASSGADADVCGCAFDKLAEKFPPREIVRANATGHMPPEMSDALAASFQQCQ